MNDKHHTVVKFNTDELEKIGCTPLTKKRLLEAKKKYFERICADGARTKE